MIKKIMIAVVALTVVSTQAFAKTSKKEDATLLSNTSTSSFSKADLDGLSILAGYDLADEAKLKTGTAETEKSFAIGAEYEFSQFSPGVAWQVGGLYELAKDIKSNDGQNSKYSLWTAYAEVIGKLTPKIKIMGGLNYNLPDLDNAPGAKLKSDFGYQIGASYIPAKNFAFDVRYRQIKMDYEQDGQNEFGQSAKFTSSVKSSGLFLSGRYMF